MTREYDLEQHNILTWQTRGLKYMMMGEKKHDNNNQWRSETNKHEPIKRQNWQQD